MIMVGIVPTRYSYKMIKESGVFVVNIQTKAYMDEFNYLGEISRADENNLAKLNSEEATIIDAPLLNDCPVNFECEVVDSILPEGGLHELFIGHVVKVHCDEEYLEDDIIQWDKTDFSNLKIF